MEPLRLIGDRSKDSLEKFKESCPEFISLLKEFKEELNSIGIEDGPFSDASWLSHLELLFVLTTCKLEALRSLRKVIVNGPSSNNIGSTAESRKAAVESVSELLTAVNGSAERRLSLLHSPKDKPIILRLTEKYLLSGNESDLFQFLFMRGASRSVSVRTSLVVKADEREQAMEVFNMSNLDLEEFLNDKRTHIVEGIIVETQDDYDGKTMRMTSEAVSALLGRTLKTDQRLKLTKTEVLNVMETAEAPRKLLKRRRLEQNGAEPSSEESDETIAVKESAIIGEVEEDGVADMEAELPTITEAVAALTAGIPVDPAAALAGQSEGRADDGEMKAYKSSLEYLDDAFQVLSLRLRIAKARHKEDLKEVVTEERPWFDNFRPSKVSTIRELRAKLKFVQNRMLERMRITEEQQKQGLAELPRMEALAQKLSFDEFEKGVVVMLAGIAISPIIKSIFEADSGDGAYRKSGDTVQVKDILTVYFDSFKDQVLARTYFYKSSKLSSRGVVKMRPAPFVRSGGDLIDQQIELDRRMLDWIVGLDTEMNELVEGSHLYVPKVSMEQVVLPAEQKNLLLRTVDNFGKFKEYRHKSGLEDVISYGAGLVILLCGASGTGKTMTVNALAHHLGKRVLLVDFHSLHSAGMNSRGDDQSSDLRGLFRDAEMNDAVIFFDECEAIFAKREKGGDRILNALLTEMERHEGIIMLATNRPLDLDEAMHRRITCVSEFRAPDHTQRINIWKVASKKLPIADSISWEQLALRYELTGGYIKNALVSALLLAISRDSTNPEVTEEDITSGCSLQMRGSLQMKSFTNRVVPKSGLDELVLSKDMRLKLESIIGFEKARGVLMGQWDFPQERLGAACLFWGPQGTGKSATAEAIGFELGRPLKVVSCAQLLSRDSSIRTGNNISATFKDARLMDALLVLEDFQVLNSDDHGLRSEEGGSNVSQWSPAALGLLLHEMEKFPGTCILIANVPQGFSFRRIEPELLRRLKFVVEFKMPDSSIRSSMWKKMLPAKVPLGPEVDFEELGKRFEFTSGAINSATVRAAAMAALRPDGKNFVTQKDLIESANVERRHLQDEFDEIVMRAFI